MRTLVTGANGQLGKSIKNLVIQQQISDSFVFATRDQLNLSDLQSLKSYFETHTFDLIINCAAYTAVDRAELDEKEAKETCLSELSYFSHITTEISKDREGLGKQGLDIANKGRHGIYHHLIKKPKDEYSLKLIVKEFKK